MSYIRVASLMVLLLASFNPEAEGQPNAAMTACALEGPNNCQLYDGSLDRTISDRAFDLVVADDFIPSSDTLTSLCVWGQYIDNDPDATQVDCSAESAPDSFIVQIFADQVNLPEFLVDERAATSVRTPANVNRSTVGAAQVFLFELSLESPITGLTPGMPYWLLVTNHSESASRRKCHWHWSKLSPTSTTGNQYSVHGPDGLFFWGDARAADYAFCMNLEIAPNGSGLIHRPCCSCSGSCGMTTMAQCDAEGGLWQGYAEACEDIACTTGPPVNDNCAAMVDVSSGAYVFNTFCATTDGPNPVNTELGPATVGNDIWFSYHNEFQCSLSFSTCDSNFDSVVAVYHDANNPNHCPCPGDENFDSFLVVASDEGCAAGAAVGGGGFARVPDECFTELGCYTIRVGGFENAFGFGGFHVFCSYEDFVPPEVTQDGLSKVRFLSMSVPTIPCIQGSTEVALRVILASLHHVAPPYSGGPSIPFTAFEGQVRWVGTPTRYVESTSSQVPFWAASLQCQPHYQDWNSVGLLHVTGSAIVPSSTYRVETLAASCQGFENHPSCLSGGFNVSNPVQIKTARWGDVETPYDPPSGTTQPDLGDIAVLVNKFKNVPGAPIKARALMVGGDAFGNITPTILMVDFGYSHIAACVDAFKGKPYPHTIQACP